MPSVPAIRPIPPIPKPPGYPSVWRNPTPRGRVRWQQSQPAQNQSFGETTQSLLERLRRYYLGAPAPLTGTGIAAPTRIATTQVPASQPYLPVVVKRAPVVIGGMPQGYGRGAGGLTPNMNWGDAQHVMNVEQVLADRLQAPRPPQQTTANQVQSMAEQRDAQFWSAGVGADWYKQYMAEHGGASPTEAYGRNYEGLREALADLEWGANFERETGTKPGEDDWRVWWFQKRGLTLPEARMAPGEYKRKRSRWAKKSRRQSRVEEGQAPGRGADRKFWMRTFGDKPPVYWKDWEKLARDQQDELIAGAGGASRKWWGYDAMGLQRGEDVPEGYQKPPLFVPPRTTWRL